ncbi:MAG: OmpA family protein [Clostridia bacterium]|nr:OmpA family protein [Clostridia bacterium]
MAGRAYSAKRPRGTDTGAHWISYSDMMASMLLVFVLAVVYSVYQYYKILDEKTREIEVQQIALSQAQQEAETERRNNEAFRIQLQNQEEELESARIILISQEQELEKSQEDLALAQENLANAQIILLAREKELEALQADLSSTQKQIETLVGIRPKIISDLSNALVRNNIDASIDSRTGDITLKSYVFFDTSKFNIKQEGIELLNQFLPVYLGVLIRPEYEQYVAEIIIEGHTDSDGTYASNLKLSQERALAVATYCLDMPGLSGEMKAKLQKIMTATGRSESDLVYNANGSENKEASRRVEFKFRLIDTQMLQQMNDILSAGSAYMP